MTRPDLKSLEALVPDFGRTLARGETVPVAGHLIVVLSGRAVAMDSSAEARVVVRRVNAGGFVGEECVVGAPSALHLRALDAAKIVLIPTASLPALFRVCPDYALHLTRTLYERAVHAAGPVEPGPRVETAHAGPERAPASHAPSAHRPAATHAAATKDAPLRSPLKREPDARRYLTAFAFNEEWFYTDQASCPVCSTSFRHLRVRTRAVHSVKRESDFYYHYRSVNPVHYAIVVCPHCRYAAYSEDFEKLPADEAQRLKATATDRQTDAVHGDMRGERDLSMVAASFRLALSCYRTRGSEAGRLAGILHRLAWVAREAGDASVERAYLQEALECYQRAYEHDHGVSEAKGINLAYFIGELALRLDRYEEAVRWFATLTRMEESRKHPEIVRLTRERWSDARQALAAQRGLSA